MLIAKMTNSGTISSDVMLFNIDSKGSAKVGSGKEAIVEVFMKVFNERLVIVVLSHIWQNLNVSWITKVDSKSSKRSLKRLQEHHGTKRDRPLL